MDDKEILRDLLDRNKIDYSTQGSGIQVENVSFSFNGANRLEEIYSYNMDNEDF